MSRVRERFTLISVVRRASLQEAELELIAFQLRKIVEGIAFGCLIACENGLKSIPRDAKGQWNAENIFHRLEKRKALAVPIPCQLQRTTEEERARRIYYHILDRPERVLTSVNLIALYQRLHFWLHEANPYTSSGLSRSRENERLISDVDEVFSLLEQHYVTIAGEVLVCVLHNKFGGTEVAALTTGSTIAAVRTGLP